MTYNGVIADKPASTGSWAKQGAGVFFLGGASTYSGSTAINNGTIRLTTADNRLPTVTVLTLGQSGSTNLGTLDLNGFNQQIAGLGSVTGSNTGASKNTVTSAAPATLTVTTTAGTSYAYGDGSTQNSGVITGSIALDKSGPGTLILGDSNTYTGGTDLIGGLLVVANTAGSATGPGSVVLDGGTLASDAGIIGGPVFAGTGAHAIAPGGLSAIGTLVLSSSLSLNGNSTLAFDISNSSTDLLQVGGPLSISGLVGLNINASGTLAGDYVLATYVTSPGIVSGDFNVSGLPPNYAVSATSTQLSLVAVPEPSTIVLLLGGGLAAFICRRRRFLTTRSL